MIGTVESDNTEVAGGRAYMIIMTVKKYYIKTKHRQPLEKSGLHFLNNLSVEIDKPRASQWCRSLGVTQFDADKNCAWTGGRQRRAR